MRAGQGILSAPGALRARIMSVLFNLRAVGVGAFSALMAMAAWSGHLIAEQGATGGRGRSLRSAGLPGSAATRGCRDARPRR